MPAGSIMGSCVYKKNLAKSVKSVFKFSCPTWTTIITNFAVKHCSGDCIFTLRSTLEISFFETANGTR
jgi:hypothetical protein